MRAEAITGLASIAVLTLGAFAADAQGTPTPQQRPGLWQSESVMAGRQFSVKSCVDAASAARMSAFGAGLRNKDKCHQDQLTHNPDGSWTEVSSCEFRPGVSRTTRADITGDFNSRISMTMRSPPSAPPEMTMTATWIGPCEPGQRGGDVIMSDGTKMNGMDAAPSH